MRGWRLRTSGFREAEALTRERGSDFGVQIARSLLGANAGVAAAQVVREITEADHARDRLKASEMNLKAVGVLQQDQKAQPFIRIPSDAKRMLIAIEHETKERNEGEP